MLSTHVGPWSNLVRRRLQKRRFPVRNLFYFMTRNDQLEIYMAQTQNVRTLDRGWAHLVRSINRDLVVDNTVSADLHTKLLALLFSAWSEATFSKLVHTPYGFDLDEMAQIKTEASRHSIVHGWFKCLQLGLQKIESSSKSSYIPNINQSLQRIIRTYVEAPSLLRNKVAHGQWNTCLNNLNTAVNAETTAKLNGVNVVTLTIWKEAHTVLSRLIEDLIVSPQKAFSRDYWTHLTQLENHLTETSTWTLEKRVEGLKRKKSFRPS